MKKELTELEIAQKEIEKLKKTIARRDAKIEKLEAEVKSCKVRKLMDKRDALLHEITSLERIQRDRKLDPIAPTHVPQDFLFQIEDAIAALEYSKDEKLQFAAIKYNSKGQGDVKCILKYGQDPFSKKYCVLKDWGNGIICPVFDEYLPGRKIASSLIGFTCNDAIEYESNDPNAVNYVLRAYQAEVDAGKILFQPDDFNAKPEIRIKEICIRLGLDVE